MLIRKDIVLWCWAGDVKTAVKAVGSVHVRRVKVVVSEGTPMLLETVDARRAKGMTWLRW